MEQEMTVVDLAALAAAGGSGAIFARETADLDLNLVRFAPGSGVGEHVNREVDVAVIVLDGEGVLTVDGEEHPLRAGRATIIPKGVRRAIQATGDVHLVYVTVHRRRRRLWPSTPDRQA
ncbi:cupin domain-containing protein [Sphaerobacter sp.]|mgnify:CR=1 FL=1|uniref:cupin domain-containing protein n=1 Tax=Sphaerobacter sp. TaxID=2099654 RepID=UPI001D460B8F|nr:cupin domain-containing protein [Sphaerobacter sp.]MBX5445791.1 cupin domain-containing protein [Sphaerobacter sp.]